ncbi:hypothetical protein [Pedosphaera parvula]|uniref:DUF4878 domain-containing protein n=1 Tax=Pedosphaera parvula (strain Ellin514) TaxID=320771 RepID=B9XPH5_PEDPL|nr:hypothetical protein [Pedosphaera parvula]EEF58315.1 hypothetical protein Cflav_PD1043 [Pedosphaera parvula Ellin514]
MTKFKLGFVSVILVTGIIASLMIHERANARLREGSYSQHENSETLANLLTENVRLSNVVERMKNSQPLSKEQLRELLKLRGQVGQLRRAGAEKGPLAAKNEQLKTSVAEAEKLLAAEQAAPNYWSKDQLTFAGYGDPESAMKSMLWAMKTGDLSSWRASCTPEAIAKMEKAWDKHGKSETERAAEMKAMGEAFMSSASGFRIIDQQMPSPDEARINLSFAGEGKARKFVLRKIGNEWRFHDMIFAGQ